MPFATVVSFSDIMPVCWFLGGHWFCTHPQVLPCLAPLKLNTMVPAFAPLHEFTFGMGQGIYSPAQRKQHQQYLMTQMSRQLVVSKLANSALATGTNGWLGMPLSLSEIDDLSYHFV